MYVCQSFDLNVYTMFDCSTNVSTILIRFIIIFCAFVLDDEFCFFEHANEFIHDRIHLPSFTEFTMILNQT